MAHVLLTSSADLAQQQRPHAFDELDRMRASAQCDKFGIHQLTDEPARADIILFIENCGTTAHYVHEVRHHPFYREYPEKCLVHTRDDFPIPYLPGIYASLRHRWYNPTRVRAGGYTRAFDHDFIRHEPDHKRRDYLYSFLGKGNTHPIRQTILGLTHDRQYLLDTSPFWPYGELSDEEQKELQNRYRDVSLRSKFILAPRGLGTSSIRLFESLRMGRPPVIIADEWVPPEGPRWSNFSIRIPESEANRIPEILEAHEDKAGKMGKRAREAWEDWFGQEAYFHRTVDWCIAIKKKRPLPETLHRLSIFPQLLRPRYLKALGRTLLPDRLVRFLRSEDKP